MLPWVQWLNKSAHHHRRDTIILVEGPFDALKLNVLGRRTGICSTCFFTNTPSAQQLDQLYDLLPRFRRRYIMLDQDMLPRAMGLANRLSNLDVQVKQLPSNRKDPGEIPNHAELQEIFG
jgi:hypothetical protein